MLEASEGGEKVRLFEVWEMIDGIIPARMVHRGSMPS
jgi:hypothetical protein